MKDIMQRKRKQNPTNLLRTYIFYSIKRQFNKMDKPVKLDEFLDAVNLEMFICGNRLVTYEGRWRYDSLEGVNCTSEKMAKAGFFCTGSGRNSDSAKCYVCQHELLWDAEDDPWEEHKKHRPDCELVKIGKQNEEELTVDEALRLMAYVYSTRQYHFVDQSIRDLNTLMDRLMLSSEKIVGRN